MGDSEISNSFSIANNYNSFFASVGPLLSSNIDKSNTKTIHSYLKQRIACSFEFECVDAGLVQKYIDDLTAKSSCGPDGISSKLLKRIKNVLADPLTVIINQSLCTGVFPDNSKLAKVVPLFKKGNPHLLDNYRHIYLLSTLSKFFLKKLFSSRSIHISPITNFSTKTNMVLENTTPRNWQPLNLLIVSLVTWTLVKSPSLFFSIYPKLSIP